MDKGLVFENDGAVSNCPSLNPTSSKFSGFSMKVAAGRVRAKLAMIDSLHRPVHWFLKSWKYGFRAGTWESPIVSM